MQIEEIRGTMESAMEKMDSVLQRVHSFSTKAKSAPVLTKQKSVLDESELHEVADNLFYAINSEASMENENKDKTREEIERGLHQASKEITRDMDEEKDESEKDAIITSELCEEPSSSLFEEISNMWRWVFS